MKVVLDLCCGTGGWAAGLLKSGWNVIGIDVVLQPEYPSQMVVGDVRKLNLKPYIGLVSFVVASPPCEEFSRWSMPWTRAKNPPLPDKSIWLACVSIAERLGVEIVIENVRGAQEFMGKAALNVGPYYLWGDVPALRPPILHRKKESLSSTQRMKRARIPIQLSEWVGECFMRGDSK